MPPFWVGRKSGKQGMMACSGQVGTLGKKALNNQKRIDAESHLVLLLLHL